MSKVTTMDISSLLQAVRETLERRVGAPPAIDELGGTRPAIDQDREHSFLSEVEQTAVFMQR